jgi:hypothetical protein
VLDEIVGHLRLDAAIEGISAEHHAPQLREHGIDLFHGASFIKGYVPEILRGLRHSLSATQPQLGPGPAVSDLMQPLLTRHDCQP